MGKKEFAIGSGIAAAAIVIIALFTNVFDLARPGFEKAVNSTADVASNVNVKGKDVVSGLKNMSTDVKNVTSQVRLKNPIP